MIRDYVLLDFHGHPARDPGGRDARPESMGRPERVRDLISSALEVDWEGASGTLEAERCVLEFDLGRDPVVGRVAVRARQGDSADDTREVRSLLGHLCRVAGWSALDVQAGDYLVWEDEQGEEPDGPGELEALLALLGASQAGRGQG